MRVFLAIELSDKIKAEIEKQLFFLKKEYPSFTWIPKENYHITVQFYGEINDEKKLVNRLKTQLFDKESFYLYGGELDFFMHDKITLFLKFYKEKKLFLIEKELTAKKNYIPHLTFGRCRIPSKQQYFLLKKRLEKIQIDISFPVKELVLLESIPNGRFPHYRKIATIPLVTLK